MSETGSETNGSEFEVIKASYTTTPNSTPPQETESLGHGYPAQQPLAPRIDPIINRISGKKMIENGIDDLIRGLQLKLLLSKIQSVMRRSSLRVPRNT